MNGILIKYIAFVVGEVKDFIKRRKCSVSNNYEISDPIW